MTGKRVVVDGPRGMVKTTLIDALRHRLGDDDINAQVSDPLSLLDCLVNSKPLRATHSASLSNRISLIDTDHIFDLVHQFYGNSELSDYETFSRAVELAALNLKPDLVVLIDSLGSSSDDTQRGYIWEAKQRGYQVMSTIGDIEPVFQKVLTLANSTKTEEPTAIGEIISKKPLQNKTKNQKSEQKTKRASSKNSASGKRHGRRKR